MDFAEGTRLVRVVPDVPAGLAAPAPRAAAAVTVVRDAGRADDDLVARHRHPRRPARRTCGAATTSTSATCTPPTGAPEDDRSVDALLDEVAEHDTVVLGRDAARSPEDEDPRARIPAWEDIVFGVRRHR